MEQKNGSLRVEVKATFDALKILINDLPFLCIKRSTLLGFQSYNENEAHYCIEFYTINGSILTQFDKKELWEKILQELEKQYIF